MVSHYASHGKWVPLGYNLSLHFTELCLFGPAAWGAAGPIADIPSHHLHLAMQAVGHLQLASLHYGQVDGQVQDGQQHDWDQAKK